MARYRYNFQRRFYGRFTGIKGHGLSTLGHVLQVRKTGWYHFLSRCMDYEGVDSGKLSGADRDTAMTFYIGSKNSPIYFCLYEKEKEQRNKGIQSDIKNRFEIHLKNEKTGQASTWTRPYAGWKDRSCPPC